MLLKGLLIILPSFTALFWLIGESFSALGHLIGLKEVSL
jgi:hypothetical protein